LPPREVENRIRREVERAVIGIPSLSQPHNIRVRRNPADEEKFFVSLECYVAPQIPVVEAHRLASMLEQELGRRFSQVADVSVHVEPAQSPPG
jgi:divalent metal cation (Fe/Co/Zn/Cd) transporter